MKCEVCGNVHDEEFCYICLEENELDLTKDTKTL